MLAQDHLKATVGQKWSKATANIASHCRAQRSTLWANWMSNATIFCAGKRCLRIIARAKACLSLLRSASTPASPSYYSTTTIIEKLGWEVAILRGRRPGSLLVRPSDESCSSTRGHCLPDRFLPCRPLALVPVCAQTTERQRSM